MTLLPNIIYYRQLAGYVLAWNQSSKLSYLELVEKLNKFLEHERHSRFVKNVHIDLDTLFMEICTQADKIEADAIAAGRFYEEGDE